MDPLPRETLENMRSTWLYPVSLHENAWVIWAPKSDRSRRIEQLLAHEISVKIVLISLGKERIEDENDWNIFCQKIEGGSPKLLCITDAELLLQDRPWLLPTLGQHYLSHPEDSFLFFSERFPYEVKELELLQHILFQPMYSVDASAHFCCYLEEKFDLRITAREKKRIIKLCGGFLWLIKHIFRLRAQMSLDEAVSDPTLSWRLDQILSGFSETEREVLQKVALTQTLEASEELETLKSLGLIAGNEVHSVLLCNRLLEQHKAKVLLKMMRNTLHLGLLDLSSLLSEKNYTQLVCLWKKNGSHISREGMAKILGLLTEDGYSDWALDQTVRRLRKRLVKFGLSAKSIQTRKNNGYQIQFYDVR